MKVLSITPRDTCRTKLKPTSPRVFFTVKDEILEDNFITRRLPPTVAHLEAARQIVKEYFVPTTVGGISWDAYAGCEMCPCSPGFIIDANFDQDFNVVLEDTELLEAMRSVRELNNKNKLFDLINIRANEFKQAINAKDLSNLEELT
jgi:hypothetical protein